MERKKYSKPFMRSETFTPEAFIAACTMPGSYSVYAPYVENGRADGWQSYGMSNMDDWYQNNWRIYFDSYTIELVSENDYQYDSQGKYWKIAIGSQGMLVYDYRGKIEYSDKNPLPQGTVIYKNLGNGVESGQVQVVNKNHS